MDYEDYENHNKYFVDLTTRANSNDQEAIRKLYNEYSNETDINQIFDSELIEFYENHESQPYSLYYYGKMNLFGIGIDQNQSLGIELLVKSKNLGCSHAYLDLAILNKLGLYNDETFDDLIKTACDMNNANAYHYLGLEAKENEDIDRFLYNMKKATELGNSNAIHQIGQYYHDIGEYELAVKYYKQGMLLQNSHCYFNYAVMYREGEGCDKDIDKAIELFKQSSELGNVKAIVSIGEIYHEQGNEELAIEYYQKVVDDPLACYNLGLIYLGRREDDEAIRMFLKGAELGNFNCIMKLARMGIPFEIAESS